MTASSAMLTHTWTVGKRYRLTLTMPFPAADAVTVAVCEWDPCMPQRLNQRERRDYQRGREAAMRLVADRIDAQKNEQNPDAA